MKCCSDRAGNMPDSCSKSRTFSGNRCRRPMDCEVLKKSSQIVAAVLSETSKSMTGHKQPVCPEPEVVPEVTQEITLEFPNEFVDSEISFPPSVSLKVPHSPGASGVKNEAVLEQSGFLKSFYSRAEHHFR